MLALAAGGGVWRRRRRTVGGSHELVAGLRSSAGAGGWGCGGRVQCRTLRICNVGFEIPAKVGTLDTGRRRRLFGWLGELIRSVQVLRS